MATCGKYFYLVVEIVADDTSYSILACCDNELLFFVTVNKAENNRWSLLFSCTPKCHYFYFTSFAVLPCITKQNGEISSSMVFCTYPHWFMFSSRC